MRAGAQAIERVKITDGERSCRQMHTELDGVLKIGAPFNQPVIAAAKP